MTFLVVQFPLRLVSELNVRENRWERAKRVKAQKEAVGWVLGPRKKRPTLPLKVTITRIAPRSFDSDNLTASGKHVRDAVADWLGVNDKHLGVEWVVVHERGKPREYAVRIVVETKEVTA